jgi:hypothetical protein
LTPVEDRMSKPYPLCLPVHHARLRVSRACYILRERSVRHPLLTGVLFAIAFSWGCGGSESVVAPSDVPDQEVTPPTPPPGMTQVTERFWNQNGEDNWGTGAGANRYVTDNTAPIDAPTVLEMPFGPCASCGSSGLGNRVAKNWGGQGLATGREVWVEHTLKYSANWASNPTANKIWYLDLGNFRPLFLATRPVDSNNQYSAMRLAMALQGQDNRACGHKSAGIWFRPNAEIVRGQWHTIQVYLRTNDPGVCNAVAKIWLDGNLVVDQSNFVFVDPGVSNLWTKINFDPVYGGGPAPIPALQTLRTAYMKVLVK